MNEVPVWKAAKWPFLFANVLLILVAAAVIYHAGRAVSHADIYVAVGCAAVGCLLGCLPFFLDYRAASTRLELTALAAATEPLADLKKYSEQIAAAAAQWALVQEATKGNTDKTVAAAKDVAQRMTDEIRDFNEFQVKLNDTEKGALRLEVEKLRRAEADWLQVLARILDHIFALHDAAVRSGNAELAAQIGQFQQTCRETARRIGLVPFAAAPDEKFDAKKHRAHGVETPPAAGVVAETLAPGLTYQGRLIRPVLVRLRDPNAPAPEPAAAETSTGNPETAAPGQLASTAD
jgi:molecular chaperone GrpE (heat shock protein)